MKDMTYKLVFIASFVCALIVVAVVGLFTSIRVAGSDNGMYGGWGFEIFVGSFAVFYFTISSVVRLLRKR